MPTETQIAANALEGRPRQPDSPAGRAVAIERVAARRGLMPPLHRRDEEETYHVLEGTLTFYVGGEVLRARRGDHVVAAPGAHRTFRVESERARWLVVTRVCSLERFEDFSRALAERVPAWPSPEEAAAVAAIGAPNGIEVLGPPGALPSAT